MTDPSRAVRLPGEHALDAQVMRRSGDGWVLVGSRCPECRSLYYPPRELCAHDLSECVAEELSREGTLYAAVQISVAPQGFSAPYWVAYVDLDDGPRVFAPLRWPEGEVPEHGATVVYQAEIVKEDPESTVGPVFMPAEDTIGGE